MAKNKTEAIITLNGQQPLQVLKQLLEAAEGIAKQIDEAQEKLKTLKPNTEPFKELTAQVKDLKKQYDLLSSAQVKDIDAVDRLKSAVDNLSSTSLKNLRKALGDGKRQLEGLSEAELEQANAIRSLMKTVGDQVRLLEGQYVKIRQGLASIGTQSDQWLSKAIRQQQELMVNTRRGTKEYKEQEQVMQMLTAEQNKRTAAISADADAKRKAQFKQQVASSRQMLSSTDTMKSHSQTEIQTAINTLKQAQGQSNVGGSEWKQYADEIAKAEERLASLAGKVKEVKQVMSEKDAKDTITFMDSHTEGEVREAINTLRLLQSQTHIGSEEWKKYAISIADAEESLAKLTGKAKEVKEGLSLTETNERMKTLGQQSEQSLQDMLRVLQEAKGSMEPFSKEWEDLAAKIENVKARMAEVSTNSPFERNYETAQKMARQDGLLDKEGALRNPTKNDLEWSKSYLQKELGNTSPLETIKINEIKEALGMLDERLSVFKDNADKSAMSAEKLNEVLGNMKTASLDDLKAASVELNKQLGKLAPSSDAAKQVKQQLQALDKEIKQVEDDVVDVNDVISRGKKGKASIEELKKAYQQLQVELNKINTGDEEFKNKQKALKDLKKEIDDVTDAAKKQGNSWNTALKNLTAYVGLFAVFNQVKTYFVDLFRLNIKFADQLTDIRKVALSTTDEVANLSRELAKIDTRTSLEELNRIVYAGAKLGIQTQGGTMALAGFVRAADQVNVALKEDLGDEALTALAKITEVMGLVKKYGVEQAMLKTGSAIFRLASTSTATSGKIVDFSNRMLALGEQAALTTPDILALGAAVDSMALEPEVAATAFGKLVTELRKGTSPIEKSLGLATGSLKKLIESGKGMDAILTIFRRMGETKNVFALDGLFKDLGSDGARLVKTMVTMASKNGMLTKAVEESNKAFAEGSAVTVEYNMQQETAAAYMERANNLWEKQFVSASAASGPVHDIAKAWFEVTKELTSSMSFMTEVRLAISLIFASIKMLLNILPMLITTLSMAGLAGAFAKLITYIQGAEVASLSLAGVWTKLQATFNKLSFAKQAGVIGGVIALLGILVVKLAEYTSSLNQASAGQRILNEVQEEGKRKAMEEQEELKRLHNVMKDTSASMDLRLQAMNKLNGAIPNLNARINTETGVVKENTKAWEDNFKRLQDYYELEGARSKLADLGRQKVDAILDLQKKEDAYANTNVIAPNGKSIQTSGGAMMPGQAQGMIGQAGQRAAAKRERDEAQERLNDINAQEDALRKKFGAKLDVGDGKAVGTPQQVANTNSGDGNATKPEDDARNNISEFITKIKNFYERQKTAMIEEMTKDGVEKEIQDQVVSDIDIRLQSALAAAKQSIVLGKNTWNDFKKTMDKDRKEKDDEYGQSQSRVLQEQINAYSVSQLRADLLKQMPKIKKGKIVGYKSDERDRAYLDRQWLDASKKENDSANIVQKRMEQRRKELLEHDYTRAVQENSFLGLINSRFADVSLGSLQKDKNDVIKVLEKARTQIADVFETDGKKDALLKFLFGENYENMPSVFLALLTDTEEDVKLFYQKLIQYSDEYVAAEKKQYDEAKKISDFMWKRNQRNLANQEDLRKMQQESSLFGKRTNMWSNLGLGDLTADPEVELMKLKMQMAEDYYAFVFKNSKNQQLIDEADRARQEAELAYANQMATAMKNRLSQMQSLVQPIETFGGEVGKAFAQMRNDVSGAQEAIKNALKSMLESWANMALNDVNTQMWKAINDAGAKRGKRKAQPGIDAARANADANAVKEDFSNLGTKANPMYVRLVDEGAAYLTPQPQSNFEKMTPQQPSLGWNPDGSPINNSPAIVPPYAPPATPEQPNTQSQSSGAPRAWEHRNRDNANAFYNDAATQTGAAAADAIAGGGSFADAAAGITGSFIGGVMNTEFKVGGKSKEDKEKAEQLKKEKKHQKALNQEIKKGAKDREKETTQGVQNITSATEEGNKAQSKSTQITQSAMTDMTNTFLTTNLAATQANNEAVTESNAAQTEAGVTLSIAGAMAKCFDFLGPIAGPIAAAGVMATLMGLLQWALNSAFSSSKKKSNTSSTNTKLVTGMLTYDSGNVQDLKPFVDDNGELYWMADDNDKEYGKKPFVADNGEVYWAKEDDGSQMQGVRMLTSPTATTINGQPSLVAERGPEIVIGRETTHAMMMNDPQLLRTLVNYDRNYSGRNSARRAFDDGNVSDVLAAGTQAGNGNLSSGASATGDLIAASAASNAALLQAVNALLQRLNEPINAKINMFGRGELYDSMNKANQFMKGK
nr:MAG TPA: tail tape measure protein [Caudoviricetes sp.]